MDAGIQIISDGPLLLLAGDFDVRSTFVVRSAIEDHLERHDDVVVDLADVDSVDLTALRVLAAASRRAVRDGRRLALRSPGPAVRRMLHLTRLGRLVEVERQAATA